MTSQEVPIRQLFDAQKTAVLADPMPTLDTRRARVADLGRALPFGGFGASGHGCHGAREGFLNYSHTKSVFRGADDSIVHKAIVPPYGAGK